MLTLRHGANTHELSDAGTAAVLCTVAKLLPLRRQAAQVLSGHRSVLQSPSNSDTPGHVMPSRGKREVQRSADNPIPRVKLREHDTDARLEELQRVARWYNRPLAWFLYKIQIHICIEVILARLGLRYPNYVPSYSRYAADDESATKTAMGPQYDKEHLRIEAGKTFL